MKKFPEIVVLLVSIALLCQCDGGEKIVKISNIVPRRDSSGKILDVHDGCLEFFQGRFYYYGTQYGKTDGFSQLNRYVSYSSKDLVEWQYHGEILKKPPPGVYYRPYVKYNPSTRKYVLWYNWYPTLWDGQYGVAVSDSPTGPFIIHDSDIKVKNDKPGDHGLFVDNDGSAYLVYTSIAKEHAISVERLSPDFLSSSLEGSKLLAKGGEAPTMFRRHDVYYVLFDALCSFCQEGTGVRVYTAPSPLGPYTLQGNINRDGKGRIIVPAQQTHIAVIPSPGGLQYVWMGDLWQSAADGIKGHDLQYWSQPLTFSRTGMVEQLRREDSVTIKLPRIKVDYRSPVANNRIQ